MILKLHSSSSVLDDYVVCPRAPVTVAELRARMLHRAKVREGSYAYRLVDDLHTAIFVRSPDLKADYEAFFSVEYGSFREYLLRRRRLSAVKADALAQEYERCAGAYHFSPGYPFLEAEYGLSFLTQLIEEPHDP